MSGSLRGAGGAISRRADARRTCPWAEDVLVQTINVEEATGLLAARYAPDRYLEAQPG